MNHQQILDKLAAKHLVAAIDEDICRLLRLAFPQLKHADFPYATLEDFVIPKLLARWNCALLAPDAKTTPAYKQTTQVALAVLLHKYGLFDTKLTQNAIQSLRALNQAVALSDGFARQEAAVIDFLLAAPTPQKRAPSLRETLTFYRACDVIAIAHKNKFYAAYIHRISQGNEYPILELYEAVFDHCPRLDEVLKHPAKGSLYDDGQAHICHYFVWGLRNTPDFAHQIHLLGSGIATPPDATHLAPSIGLGMGVDLFEFMDYLV